jgi:hypothetical protein
LLALIAVVIGLVAAGVAYTSLFRSQSPGRRVAYSMLVAVAVPLLLFLLLGALVGISFLVESRS